MLQSKATWKIIDEMIDEHDQCSIEEIINKLLLQKGIEAAEDREKFLHPSLDFIQPAEKLAHIEKAKNRVERAINDDEYIIVYGDYDADGVTATTVLVEGLRMLGANCQYYIPNRFSDGYGLNEQKISEFANDNVSLIITVDTGIANVEEVKAANELGIDIIITDHHEIQDELPPAFAIIHPALSENYSFKSLAGVGVAFQFVHYLLGELPEDLLDLVAIGTIADLVPLVGENRIFAYAGLKQINKTNRIGLKKIIQSARIDDEITSWDIAFRIAPRINAVGRLEDASIVVQLLLTSDEMEAEEIITYIESLNNKRKQLVDTIVAEAKSRVDEDELFIMLADETWHEGVLGIAASHLVKQFHRPVLLLTKSQKGNTLKGSARSIPAFDLFQSGLEIKHLFTSFGGHSQAAGLSFTAENFDDIKAHFMRACEEQLRADDFKPEIVVSQQLQVGQISEKLVKNVNMLAPFGFGNEEPLFLIEAIPTQVRQIGQNNAHLKLQFYHDENMIEAIGFHFGKLAPLISKQAKVSFVGSLAINEWNGNRTVQIVIEDIAVKEWQLFDFRGKKRVLSIDSFIQADQNHVLVCEDESDVVNYSVFNNLHITTYEKDPTLLPKANILFIYDLPKKLDALINVIKYTKPNAIHVSYDVKDSTFLIQLPNRDQFKSLYGYIKKFEPIYLTSDLPKIIQLTKLPKEVIIFMIKVFRDLQFIKVDEQLITINDHAQKTDLTESRTYQNLLELRKIEKILYYSSYEELKHWLQNHALTFEEEKVHGFKTTY